MPAGLTQKHDDGGVAGEADDFAVGDGVFHAGAGADGDEGADWEREVFDENGHAADGDDLTDDEHRLGAVHGGDGAGERGHAVGSLGGAGGDGRWAAACRRRCGQDGVDDAGELGGELGVDGAAEGAEGGGAAGDGGVFGDVDVGGVGVTGEQGGECGVEHERLVAGVDGEVDSGGADDHGEGGVDLIDDGVGLELDAALDDELGDLAGEGRGPRCGHPAGVRRGRLRRRRWS